MRVNEECCEMSVSSSLSSKRPFLNEIRCSHDNRERMAGCKWKAVARSDAMGSLWHPRTKNAKWESSGT